LLSRVEAAEELAVVMNLVVAVEPAEWLMRL
jgi:hypothetical protein